MKFLNRMKNDAETRTVSMILAVVLIALACIMFPSAWLSNLVGELNSLAIIRYVFAVVGIIFMCLFGFYDNFKLKKDFVKYLDIIIITSLFVVNNFPIIGLSTGNVAITKGGGQIAAYISFCFSVGLFEEIFFRGLLIRLLLIIFKDRAYSQLLAVIVSSLIFGLVHLANLLGGAGFGAVIMQVGYSAATGAAYGIIFILTKSLIFPVLFHAVFDIGGLMTTYIATGKIWDTATIVITAILGVIAALYITIRFVLISRNRAELFKQEKVAAIKRQPSDDVNE